MNSKAAIFVTDSGFLVPSLLAAVQLKTYRIESIADIIIFLVDVDSETVKRLKVDFESPTFYFRELDKNEFLPPEGAYFRQNHVPVTTLARLALAPHLDLHYEDIVYIDGDVQIYNDPTGLFEVSVPYGKILAAPGSAWLNEIEGRAQLDEIQQLSLDPINYFNAGILAFSRETWAVKGPEALKFFLSNPSLCETHDQTALNAVFSGDVISLSPLYNFHNLYTEAYVHWGQLPIIIHFTGPRKPWNWMGAPWFGAFRSKYLEFIDLCRRKYCLLRPLLSCASRQVAPRRSGSITSSARSPISRSPPMRYRPRGQALFRRAS